MSIPVFETALDVPRRRARPGLMAAEIIHNNHIVQRQGRDQNLPDIGEERIAFDGPGQHEGCVSAVMAQGYDEGDGHQ